MAACWSSVWWSWQFGERDSVSASRTPAFAPRSLDVGMRKSSGSVRFGSVRAVSFVQTRAGQSVGSRVRGRRSSRVL